MRLCFFTDHQLFDRFHKYNLKSDKARSGKVALSLKELNQFTPGDYVVHTDHGIGRFSGLVRIPNGDTTQEVLKLVFQNEDVVFVSIHSLHKVSKYKGKEGEAPRLNKLGTGAWEKLKELSLIHILCGGSPGALYAAFAKAMEATERESIYTCYRPFTGYRFGDCGERL